MDENKLTNDPGDQEMSFVSRVLYQFIDEKYRPLLDESSDLMCITGRDGKFIYVNKKLVDSLGYTKKEMLGMHMNDIIAPESLKNFQESAKDFLKTGKITIENFILKTKYKGRIVGEMSCMAFYDNNGKYCGAKAVFRDQTKLLAIESLEKKYESMMEDGIGSLDSVIIILDRGLRIKWASAGVQKYFGLDKAVIVGEDMRELFRHKMACSLKEGDEFLKNLLAAYEAGKAVESFECDVAVPGGGEGYILEHWSYPITHGDLNGGRIEIFRDITARKKAEETLEYYYKKIHAIMEHAVEGIVELRTDNTIGFINKSFLSMMGYTEMEMLNRVLADFIAPDERMRLASIKLIRKAREITFIRKDDTPLYTLMSSIPLVFGNQPPHALCFIADITETKMTAIRLRDANLTLRALNDSLLDVSLRDVRTGVYNFRYLNERLSEEIKRARRYFRPFSVILMDIDFFKAVNDAYGHSFGDVVLRAFSDLLKKTVRETDVVVRSGGEEFVIFLADTDVFGALAVAHKIIAAVATTPLGDARRKVGITISIGISSYPEAGISDAASLLDAADQAMYQSKQEGRNRITVFKHAPVPAKTRKPKSDDQVSFEDLQERLRNINTRNEESVLEAMMPMVREVDKRTGHAFGHVERVVNDAEVLAASFSMSAREIRDIKRAALLCNLGLLGVPARVLKKKGRVAASQLRLIREHPGRSLEIIKDFSFLRPLAKNILHHHERYDGKGYPEKLKAGKIPRGARIILIAETFEALIVPRPYRSKAYSRGKSLEIIKKESGRQFDPLLVEHFLKIAA